MSVSCRTYRYGTAKYDKHCQYQHGAEMHYVTNSVREQKIFCVVFNTVAGQQSLSYDCEMLKKLDYSKLIKMS